MYTENMMADESGCRSCSRAMLMRHDYSLTCVWWRLVQVTLLRPCLSSLQQNQVQCLGLPQIDINARWGSGGHRS